MKKNTIRLNESQLHRIIKESVKRVLREECTITIGDPNDEIGESFSVELGTSSYAGSIFFNIFGVFSAEEALDCAVDYCESHGINGPLGNEEMADEYPDDYICAGNHSLPIDRSQVHIKKI